MLAPSGILPSSAKSVQKDQSVLDQVRSCAVLAVTALDQLNLANLVRPTAGLPPLGKPRSILAFVKLDTFGKQQQMAMSLARRVQLGMHVLTK